jgi:outer membrane protein TolC
MPIDLHTALRVAQADNPTIAQAEARAREAQARLAQSRLLWLPDLTAGTSYLRHDGQIQNSRGEVFTTSRSSLFIGSGPQLRVDTSDALFLPLIAERLAEARSAEATAVGNTIQLEVALAYLDLVQVHGLLAINADTLARARQMLDRAEAAEKAGVSKTRADVNRANTEVQLRLQERIILQGRVGQASARLARLLLLRPSIDLVPADSTVLPVTLVPPEKSLDELVALGLANRPELAAARASASAADVLVRQARLDPLIPRLQVDYLAGGFGGGRNDLIGNFNGRGDAIVSAVWELRNLGLGYRTEIQARRAHQDQAQYRVAEVQALVGAEIAEAAKIASARYQALNAAQEAVKQAAEMYRKLLETQFGILDPKKQYDALEPLIAIQTLNQARVEYLNSVIEFNRAQFRLYTALGQPALCALPDAVSTAVSVPAIPPPPDTRPMPKPER